MNRTDLVERPYLRDDLPTFRAGDTVRVHVRVVEGERERVGRMVRLGRARAPVASARSRPSGAVDVADPAPRW